MRHQRDIVVTLLKAGRRDLACVIAKLFVGDTYHAKDLLKKHRARWRSTDRAWDVPDKSVDDAIDALQQEGFNAVKQGNVVKIKRGGGGGGAAPSGKAFIGDTYDAKDTLKRHGARWAADDKAWVVPDKSVDDAIKALQQDGFGVTDRGRVMEIKRGGGGAAPRRSGSGKASSKQVDYAARMINRMVRHGDWFDSEFGDGMDPPTVSDLENMTSREISEWIDSLRREYKEMYGR